ncbi:MAG TPA: dTDP-4-dehydrorhamnose reductase [Acidimicrobiales bacterium]|nr:dTDP-4-dehydrorhamnose reductase [Acidimicrobiales bacterium]
MSRAIRVLVTGAAGQVGVDLLDTLRGLTPLGGDASFQPDAKPVGEDEFEVLGLDRHDLDVTDRDAVLRSLRAARPDAVVHLAAYTAVDRAEDDVETCFDVNENGTANLSLGARDVGAHLVTISTDYVFDGTKGAAYVEEDETRPLSVYGASKRDGERHCLPEDTIVRTSWVMGVRGKNVVHVIAERAASGATVRFVDDQMGTVTSASDLARSLVTLVRERPGGIWHVANSDATTWFDVAAHVGTVLARGDDFATPIKTGELSPPPLATRPARSDLNTNKFASSFAALPAWRDAVARLVLDLRRDEVTP